MTKYTSRVKFSLSFPDRRAKLWKNALYFSVNESFKNFLNPDTDVDNFPSSSSFVTWQPMYLNAQRFVFGVNYLLFA